MRLAKWLVRSKVFKIIVSSIYKSYIVLLLATCKFKYQISDDFLSRINSKECMIFAYWHGRFMIFPKLMARYGKFAAVVSSSNDGGILTYILESYGHHTVRGSTRKDGVNAMRGVLGLIKKKISFGITPDGPKGPCFAINGNITQLAHKYKLPVVMMSYSVSRYIKLNTWDQLIIPLPFSKIIIDISDALHFDDKADDEYLRQQMIKQMQRLDHHTKLKGINVVDL